MRKKGWDKLVLLLFLAGVLSSVVPADAQLPNPFREIAPPGQAGVRIHPGAMVPSVRKWYLPQNLYYEYRWRAWEYSNYAREPYQRYVGTLLNGERLYDPLGNYIARGWEIYDWTEQNPRAFGSGLFKSPRYNDWFSNVIVSAAHKGQFHTAVTIGDAIRTTLTPMTFSKPAFNGVQWDFLTDKYGLTFIGSRVSSTGGVANNQLQSAVLAEASTRVLGGRGVAQVGDFGQVGFTYVTAHNADNNLALGDNSLNGVLTSSQNQGNVEEIKIRISDDSPESPEDGAVLFLQRILIDGQVQRSIVPLIEGGIEEDGVLFARGQDEIVLSYDIRNDFDPTPDTPSFRNMQKIEFELIVANDYNVEVTSNKQLDAGQGFIYLPVARADDNTTDGSNQRVLRFEYGLPTSTQVVGIDFNVTNIVGFDLTTEYVVNRRFQRFPNQGFPTGLDHTKETAEAFYLTTSYIKYPFFGYGETFRIEPDYTTSAFMTDGGGNIFYDRPERYRFEFVDDNDDQDQTPDWARHDQGGANILFTELASGSGNDRTVFPGLDENNDFVSDFNQNRNDVPDYADPFLRYQVDAPEFLFGMDMNNNTLIDRFEDDLVADYPYRVDRSGYNIYGGTAIGEETSVTIGRVKQREISSGRENNTSYGLVTSEWSWPGIEVAVFEHLKFAKDDIIDDRFIWVDPEGSQTFNDPVDAKDAAINSFYAHGKYTGFENLNFMSKFKYDHYFQRRDQSDLKDNSSFVGLINRVDYTYYLRDDLRISPKFKSTFRNRATSQKDLRSSRDREEAFFLLTRYAMLPTTWIDVGLEFSRFSNLKEGVLPGEEDDFNNFVFAILFSNTSSYVGYNITLNAGFQRERQKFEGVDALVETTAYMRIFAATGEEY